MILSPWSWLLFAVKKTMINLQAGRLGLIVGWLVCNLIFRSGVVQLRELRLLLLLLTQAFALLACDNYRDLLHILIVLFMWKVNLKEKNQLHILPIEKFPSHVLPRNAITLQHLIIQIPLYYLSSGHLHVEWLKTN